MTFPTIESATSYIQGKLQDFYNQSGVLKSRLLAIGKLMQLAKASNDQEALGKLILAQTQAKDLMNEQLSLEDQLKPFADYFGVKTTLGMIPLILLPIAAGVATLLYLHFEKIQNQKNALDLIAKGMISPDQAKAILEPGLLAGIFGGGSSAIWLYLILGAAGYVYLTSRR